MLFIGDKEKSVQALEIYFSESAGMVLFILYILIWKNGL